MVQKGMVCLLLWGDDAFTPSKTSFFSFRPLCLALSFADDERDEDKFASCLCLKIALSQPTLTDTYPHYTVTLFLFQRSEHLDAKEMGARARQWSVVEALLFRQHFRNVLVVGD